MSAHNKKHPVTFDERSARTIGKCVGLQGEAVKVRSKFSGKEGVCFVNDPHVFVEGAGIVGWYRQADIDRDFLKA